MKTIILSTIGAVLLAMSDGCFVTTDPDGTKTISPDYSAWAGIIRLITPDAVPQIIPSK